MLLWIHKQKLQALGGLVRNLEGNVIALFCLKLPTTYSPEVAEALALRKTMLICMESGLNHVIFEGDGLTVVNAVNSREITSSELCSILHDIHHLMFQRTGWQVCFLRTGLHMEWPSLPNTEKMNTSEWRNAQMKLLLLYVEIKTVMQL